MSLPFCILGFGPSGRANSNDYLSSIAPFVLAFIAEERGPIKLKTMYIRCKLAGFVEYYRRQGRPQLVPSIYKVKRIAGQLIHKVPILFRPLRSSYPGPDTRCGQDLKHGDVNMPSIV